MRNGDISNLASPQLVVVTDVVVALSLEETGKFLTKKVVKKIGELNLLSANQLWTLANQYGVSLELAGFEEEGWTEELLDKAFEKLERRAVNPFNYWQLYESPHEIVGGLPYRANLRGVIDIPGRVAIYGSAGIELQNL